MPRPMRLLVPAIFAMAVPTFAPAEGIAGDCLSKPNGLAPDGQHWYYRIDRATKQRCWFLAAADRPVRSETAPRKTAKVRTRVSTKPVPTVTPASEATPEPPTRTRMQPRIIDQEDTEQGAKRAPDHSRSAERVPDHSRSAERVLDHSQRGVDDPHSGFARRWADASAASVSVSAAREQHLRMSFAEELSKIHEEDMPLVWPVLSPSERQLADSEQQLAERPQSTALHVLLAVVGGALGIIGVFAFTVFKLAAARPWRRRRQARRFKPCSTALGLHPRQLPTRVLAREPARRIPSPADAGLVPAHPPGRTRKSSAPTSSRRDDELLQLLEGRRRVAA